MRDASGKVIAVLFIGFDYTDEQKTQSDNLKRFVSARRFLVAAGWAEALVGAARPVCKPWIKRSP